jgi:hypothetical protein
MQFRDKAFQMGVIDIGFRGDLHEASRRDARRQGVTAPQQTGKIVHLDRSFLP